MIQSQSFMAKSNFEWLVPKFLPKFLGIIHAKSHFLMVNSEVFSPQRSHLASAPMLIAPDR